MNLAEWEAAYREAKALNQYYFINKLKLMEREVRFKDAMRPYQIMAPHWEKMVAFDADTRSNDDKSDGRVAQTVPESAIANNLTVPLTCNDRSILEAMLELKAFISSPVSSPIILNRALSSDDPKRAFKRLKRNDLVDAKSRHGRWLTKKGMELANELKAANAMDKAKRTAQSAL